MTIPPDSDLKNKAVSSTIWSAIDTFARQSLSFAISLVLARLLTPYDYGTVGLLTIFIGVAGVFINCGFSSALIQRQEVSDTDLSSVFYLNVAIALVVSVLLALSAPFIAAFYEMPVLKPLTWVTSATLFVGAFGNVQSTLLTKSLDFRRQCLISLASLTVSSVVAIFMAWHDYGVWSLAVSSLTGIGVSTSLLWLSSNWRPRLAFSTAAIRSLFRFSSFLLISGLLDTLFTRLNTLVIGKFYSVRELGFYSRADGTQQLPASLLSGVISRVAFPIFAAAHQDKELLRAGLKKAILLAMMVNVPVMLGIAVTARPLVITLFGGQWLPCVPYLQILCLGGILWPLHVINLNVLTAMGHSDLFFRIELVKKGVGIVILGTACFYGILAIAWSTVVSGIFYFVVNAYYSGRLLNYGVRHQTLDLLPYLAASLCMALCVAAAAMLPIQSPFLLLALQVLLGAAVYLALCYSLRLPVFIESLRLITSRLRSIPSIG